MFSRTPGALALALTLPLVACADGAGVGDQGSISLLLTDEAGDFQQASVTIERIELVGKDEEPLVLMDSPVTRDLLTLANDALTLVEEETVPAGTYSQLRFIIPEACIVVEQEDGSGKVFASQGFTECGPADGSLQLPSFAQTGIKVNLPGGSIGVTGEQKILLLDFDVSRSFGQEAGMSGMWVMTPVINAEDVSLTGSVVVELTEGPDANLAGAGASPGDFQARLSTEAVPQPFGDTDGDGVYTASFLMLLPGDGYEVSLEAKDGVELDFTLDPASSRSVSVPSGEEVEVAFEVTSASAP